MLGPIITAGVGVLAFRLGSVANKLSSEGKSYNEMLPELGEQLCSDVQCGYCWCREKLANLVGYTFEDVEEEPTPAKPSAKRSHHKKTPAKPNTKRSHHKKPVANPVPAAVSPAPVAKA